MVYGPRLVVKFSSVETQPESAYVIFEDDAHVYTCDVGKGCYIERYLDWYFIIKPFLDSFEG